MFKASDTFLQGKIFSVYKFDVMSLWDFIKNPVYRTFNRSALGLGMLSLGLLCFTFAPYTFVRVKLEIQHCFTKVTVV